MRIRTQFLLVFLPVLALASGISYALAGPVVALLIMGLGGVLLTLSIGVLNKALKSIDALVEAAEDVSQGRKGTLVQIPFAAELGRLAKSFNRMSTVLEAEQTSKQPDWADQIRHITDRLTPPIAYNASQGKRTRILFFGEAVTLAHVARPMMLAKGLDPARFEVLFACDPRYLKLFGDLPFPVRPIRSISSQQFTQALHKVAPLYDAQTLRSYVKEDLEVIREFNPDVIVGDFRLSLAISAPLAQCPTIQIMNAYWNDQATRAMPVPDEHKMPHVLFELAQPAVLAWHRWSINRLRREHGLPSLQQGIGQSRIWGDHVLYADIPEMVPMAQLPANHHYLGPMSWSPSIDLPDWWDTLPADKPLVYVGLGSSGSDAALPVILQALSGMPVSVAVATGGRPLPSDLGDNIFVAEVLPGDRVCARADLVICNGGSPSTAQAMMEGIPVIGIASNMDQCLNMEAVCRTRAGEMIQAGSVTPDQVREAVTQMLSKTSYRAAAQRLSVSLKRHDAPAEFSVFVNQLLRTRPSKVPVIPSTPSRQSAFV